MTPERLAYLEALAETYGADLEALIAIDEAMQLPTPGGNVWPYGMD